MPIKNAFTLAQLRQSLIGNANQITLVHIPYAKDHNPDEVPGLIAEKDEMLALAERIVLVKLLDFERVQIPDGTTAVEAAKILVAQARL